MIFKQKQALSLALLLVASHACFNTLKPITLEEDLNLLLQEQKSNPEETIHYLFNIFLTDQSVKLPLRYFFEKLIEFIKLNSLEIKKRVTGVKGSDKDKFIEEFIATLLALKDCSKPLQDGALIGIKLKKYLPLLPKESRSLFEKIGTNELRKIIQFRIKLNTDLNAEY